MSAWPPKIPKYWRNKVAPSSDKPNFLCLSFLTCKKAISNLSSAYLPGCLWGPHQTQCVSTLWNVQMLLTTQVLQRQLVASCWARQAGAAARWSTAVWARQAGAAARWSSAVSWKSPCCLSLALFNEHQTSSIAERTSTALPGIQIARLP